MRKTYADVRDVIYAVPVSDGAGVKLSRIIGNYRLDHLDPFMLLDEFRSEDESDFKAGFPDHPHRGIETVTYMLRGRFRHHDSNGGGGILKPGSVQWMTAGRGIIHSEMPEHEGGKLWGFQLWLSLPAADKMTAPRYQYIAPDRIPWILGDGHLVKVIAGDYNGHAGPVQARFPVSYFDITVSHGRFRWEVPEDRNTAGYVHTGGVVIGEGERAAEVPQGGLFLLDDGKELNITSTAEEAGVLLVTGRPHNEPIVRQGPFVMNTREEIEQAYRDYEMGMIGK